MHMAILYSYVYVVEVGGSDEDCQKGTGDYPIIMCHVI